MKIDGVHRKFGTFATDKSMRMEILNFMLSKFRLRTVSFDSTEWISRFELGKFQHLEQR